MLYKYQYTSTEERDTIVTNNPTLFLREEQNIIEGNFLIFSDTQPQVEVIEVEKSVDNAQLIELQSQNLILMDALATLYETVLGGTL